MPSAITTEQAFGDLMSAYEGLSEPQLACFHRVPRWRIREWREGEAGPPQAEETSQNVFHSGGFSSGKSYEQRLEEFLGSMTIPGNSGLIVREQWEEIQNHVIEDIYDYADTWTGGHRHAIMTDFKQVAGSFVAKVNTIVTPEQEAMGVTNEPSTIIIKNEPDGDAKKVAEHFKGPEYGWVDYEEMLQLKELTWETAALRVRRPLVHLFPFKMWEAYGRPGLKKYRGDERVAYKQWALSLSKWKWRTLGVYNPPYDGHWIAKKMKHYEELDKLGQRTRESVLVIKSAPRDNKHMSEDYEMQLREMFKNDPVKLQMHMSGDVGVEVDGVPVFGEQYDIRLHDNPDAHYNPFRALYIGLDFGFHNPAAVFAQVDDDGAIQILHEYLPSRVTAKAFGQGTKEFIWKHYRKLVEAGSPIIVYGDIAGEQEKDTGDSITHWQSGSGLSVLTQRLGMNDSLDRVRDALSMMVGHPPRARLRIVKRTCPILHQAFLAGYHYKVKDGRREPVPFKTMKNKFDDVADAVRYLVAGIIGVYGEMNEHLWNPTGEEVPEFMPSLDEPEGVYY